jgi:membrane protease subunit HflC
MTDQNRMPGARRLSAGRLGAVALTLAALMGIFSMVVVESGQVGVVIRAGTDGPVRVISEPGIYARLPFVERVWLVDTRWQTAEQAAPQAYVSQDQQTLQLAGWAVWRVNDPQRFNVATAAGKNGIEERIFSILKSTLEPIVQAQTAGQVDGVWPAALQTQWLAALNAQLEPRGIVAAQVGIRQIGFSDAFNDAVYQRMSAGRRQSEQQVIKGLAADEQQLVALQTQQRERVLTDAYRQAQQQRQSADARLVSAYARQYGQPEIFRALLTDTAVDAPAPVEPAASAAPPAQ